MEAKIKAQAASEVNLIEMQKQVAQKESQKKIEDIENEIFLNKEKARADANHYSLMKNIEAEHAQLTKEYLMKL